MSTNDTPACLTTVIAPARKGVSVRHMTDGAGRASVSAASRAACDGPL